QITSYKLQILHSFNGISQFSDITANRQPEIPPLLDKKPKPVTKRRPAGRRRYRSKSCGDVRGHGYSRLKGNSGEIRTGVPYKFAAASDGSPSAALEQPHLVTTTHWTTSFR